MMSSELVLRLHDLPPGHSRLAGRLAFDVEDAAGLPEPYAVRATCDVDNLGARVHVRGDVVGQAQASCHRCLRSFERPVQAAFDLTLQRGGPPAGDDDEWVHVPEHAVSYDLEPHVREAVILEEPIRLVCDPECRGLCDRCGADLNQGPCGCAPPDDPRWAPLSDLRHRL
jgi:uncharacterized metal-binding protein YceD (DUF177 family)